MMKMNNTPEYLKDLTPSELALFYAKRTELLHARNMAEKAHAEAVNANSPELVSYRQEIEYRLNTANEAGYLARTPDTDTPEAWGRKLNNYFHNI